MNYLYIGIAIVVIIVIIYFVTRGGGGGGGPQPINCTSNCDPYTCDTTTGNCNTSCQNSNQCQDPGTCNANGKCVVPGPGPGPGPGPYTCSSSNCQAPSTCVNNVCTAPFDCSTCTTYACNQDKTACLTQCTTPKDCVVPGSACTSGQCVPPFNCASCSPYACDTGNDACLSTCTGPTDTTSCAPKFICNSSNNCVAPPFNCTTCANGCNAAKTACNPPPAGAWEGWATTTEFGSGDGSWPGSTPGLNLCNKILGRQSQPSPASLTMGAAIPWNFVCSGINTTQTDGISRNEWIQSIINSAQGIVNPETKELDNACFLIQPVVKFPDEISGGVVNLCTGSDCTDITADGLAAMDASGNQYPSYLIIPYEGCGGDCTSDPTFAGTNHKDCINSCSDVQTLVGTCGPVAADPTCTVANVMANAKWDPSTYMDTIYPASGQYLNYYPAGISEATDYGHNAAAAAKKSGGVLNWCTGANMHFDIAQDSPLWEQITAGTGTGPASTTAASNIIVRYQRVPCNHYGNFDPSWIPGSYAGGWISGTPCEGSVQGTTNAGCESAAANYCSSMDSSCDPNAKQMLACCPWGLEFQTKTGAVDANGWYTDGCCVNPADTSTPKKCVTQSGGGASGPCTGSTVQMQSLTDCSGVNSGSPSQCLYNVGLNSAKTAICGQFTSYPSLNSLEGCTAENDLSNPLWCGSKTIPPPSCDGPSCTNCTALENNLDCSQATVPTCYYNLKPSGTGYCAQTAGATYTEDTCSTLPNSLWCPGS